MPTQTAVQTVTFASERRRLLAELKQLYTAHGLTDHFACLSRLDDGFFAQQQHLLTQQALVRAQDEAKRRAEHEFEVMFPEEARRQRQARENFAQARRAHAAEQQRQWAAEEERRRQREALPIEQRLAELEEELERRRRAGA